MSFIHVLKNYLLHFYLISLLDDVFAQVTPDNFLNFLHSVTRSVLIKFLLPVLIEKAKRGHGFGKKLMEFTEAHASQ